MAEAAAPLLVDLPLANPSDCTFGGPGLDRLYVTSIALDLGGGTGEHDGRLLALDLAVGGRPEARLARARTTSERHHEEVPE
jgi:sugar lactone lactonase YvrE